MNFNLWLPLLIMRTRLFCLCLFHQVYNHDLLWSLLIPPLFCRSSRVDHVYKVVIAHCQTNTVFHSSLPRTSNYWNRLPADLASITDDELFRCSFMRICFQMTHHNLFFSCFGTPFPCIFILCASFSIYHSVSMIRSVTCNIALFPFFFPLRWAYNFFMAFLCEYIWSCYLFFIMLFTTRHSILSQFMRDFVYFAASVLFMYSVNQSSLQCSAIKIKENK